MSYLSGYTGAEVDALLTQAETRRGFVALPVGEASGEVTGLALGFVPSGCQLTVKAPNDSDPPLAIAATLWGDPDVNGFSYILTGLPDRAGYTLHYTLTPAI